MVETSVPALRIAYLVNRYPAASHSFIRREIVGLEAVGVKVDRWSIRRPQGDVPDPGDKAELSLTRYVLEQSVFNLFFSTVIMAARRPMAFARAIICAFGMAQPTIKAWIRHLAYVMEAGFLCSVFAREAVDHVHAHFGTNPAAVARLIRVWGGPTYSFTVHGPDEFDDPRGLDLNGKVRDSLLTFAISHFGASQLMRWSNPGDWDKIRIARCGVDETFLAESACIPIKPDPVLCCVARLSGQKGLPLLIQAAAKVREAFGDFTLNLVGDGEMRPQIEAMIVKQGVSDCVHILGWSAGSEVQQQLLAARAMVLPSFAEGLPVVIMEALALGRPVIATAIAGTPELVDSGCGWLVPAGSIEAVAFAMLEALRMDTSKLEQLGAEGRRRVVEFHDANRNSRSLYQAIADAKVLLL